jgi:hypothetical protein
MNRSKNLILTLASLMGFAGMTQTIFAANVKPLSQNSSVRVNETVTNRAGAKVAKTRTRKKARGTTKQNARQGNTRVRNLLPYMEQSNLRKSPKSRHPKRP